MASFDNFNANLRKLWPKLKDMKLKNERALPGHAYVPTELEHIANVVTHGLWVPAACYATIELLIRSHSSAQQMVALIYGGALIMLFTVSTCFHCSFYCDRHNSWKHLLHRADRAMIYIFIAGSYYPWLNLGHDSSHPHFKLILNWFVWILAGFGIVYQQVFHEKYKFLETCLYLVMSIGPSFCISFCKSWAYDDMTCKNDIMWKTELKVGGILYLIGVFFFKSDGKIPFAHAIWHGFVGTAAFIHYYAILNHLFPYEKELM